MRWACVLLPHLAIDAVLRRHPDPDAPLALATGPAQRQILHALNPAAQALGLQCGMPVTDAQLLMPVILWRTWRLKAARMFHVKIRPFV